MGLAKRMRNIGLAAFLVLLLVGVLHAEGYDLVGTLTPDGLVKPGGTYVTLLFTVDNHTQDMWTPRYPQRYHFEVFDILHPEGGGQVGSGDLVYSQEQYVAGNSSTAFAIGKFLLVGSNGKALKPGLYRILLYSVEFKNVVNHAVARIAASTAIRVLAPTALQANTTSN
jgi:hypothetical protein